MNIQENISLLPYNTFGIDKKARFFVRAENQEDIRTALTFAKEKQIPLLVLGGGSNILLTKDLEALVLKIDIKGIQVTKEDAQHIWVAVGAGEKWHEFVLHALGQNWSGVENLSLIPGTVGASPMQNIGAYGVEIKEVFESLEAIHVETLESRVFDTAECQFGYRESVFKKELKGQYIISSVTFKLSKEPKINLSYGTIQQTLEEMGIDKPGIKEVSDAVIKIRQSKLPDPKKIGNAGSFFKNPTISREMYDQLKSAYPNIPGFPNDEGIKVPAAWLIENTGWKGHQRGKIGVHQFQPLVLVNFGGGDGNEIARLSEEIQESVKNKFGIELQPEVNFL